MNKKAKIHNITRAIAICIALVYTGLSAQSKGFTDTVILKNGTVLSGVKATVTKDSLVVTNPEGETSVFTKKEVSEVKKGGAGNSTNTTKPDPKPTPSSGKWSADQGDMNWEDAKKKCVSIGMRLPTRDELVAAHKAGLREKWDAEASDYGLPFWTSEESSIENAYVVSMFNGGDVYGSGKGNGYINVRCVR